MKKKAQVEKRYKKMVDDPLRTPLLLEAIQKTVKPGMTVLDLGCGTGILTKAALDCGASKVYACDVDASITLAQKRCAEFSDRVEFFNELSSEIELPEKVDIILCETVGTLGFDENILPFSYDAITRFLKPKGKIIPSRIELWAAPVLIEKKLSSEKWHAVEINPEDLKAKSELLFDCELKKNNYTGIDTGAVFKLEKSETINGFAVWHKTHWIPGLVTSSSPESPQTHWEQGFLPTDKKLNASKKIQFRLQIAPLEEDIFSTQTEIGWGYKAL